MGRGCRWPSLEWCAAQSPAVAARFFLLSMEASRATAECAFSPHNCSSVWAPSRPRPLWPPAAYPARRLPRSQLVERLMLRAVAPSRVYAHNWEPGDVVLADNHACWHSATGGLGPSDKRVMHLSTWDGSAPPLTG